MIGVEYASMFGALGTKVTVVDKRDRVVVVAHSCVCSWWRAVRRELHF